MLESGKYIFNLFVLISNNYFYNKYLFIHLLSNKINQLYYTYL